MMAKLTLITHMRFNIQRLQKLYLPTLPGAPYQVGTCISHKRSWMVALFGDAANKPAWTWPGRKGEARSAAVGIHTNFKLFCASIIIRHRQTKKGNSFAWQDLQFNR